MKNKLLFSFVVPTHNSKSTIIPLLDSINNSKLKEFKSFEMIIIDDNSKDNTFTIVNKNLKKYKFKVSIYSYKKHIGPAKARNKGAELAQGKFLVFLDGDVSLQSTTLKNIYELLKSNKIQAFTGIWDYHQKTKAFFPQFKALRDWSYWFSEKIEDHRYYLFSTRIAGIDRKLFTRLKGFNESYPEPTVEDIEFTYRIEKIIPIKFASNIVVNHEFEGFKIIAVKYFKRSRDWIKLFTSRRQFDPVATSKREAVKPFIIIFIVMSLMFFALTRLMIFVYLIPLIFVFYLIREGKFLHMLYQKKGFVFMLKSIPVSIVLYLVILMGAGLGMYEVFRTYIYDVIKQKSAVDSTS